MDLPVTAWRLLAPVLMLLAPLAARADEAPAFDCPPGDRACMFRALDRDPVRRLSAWHGHFARPLLERVEPAPPALVRYLNLDNIANGYPERPRSANVDARFIADVQAALADLPRDVLLKFPPRLAGIFLVDSLGGTGYTDFIVDDAGQPAGGFVVLDAGVLGRHTANAWASWKEGTPFRPDPDWTIEAKIEHAGQDTRRSAIRYILLHELGHVLSIGGTVHPVWNVRPREVKDPEAYAFFWQSWRIDADRDAYVSIHDAAFRQRRNVAYYFGAKLDAIDMAPTYALLAKTNFPTLYAATAPGDDFAESFASYVHTVLMGRPWEIAIKRKGEVAYTFGLCWAEERCAEKRKLLEAILK